MFEIAYTKVYESCENKRAIPAIMKALHKKPIGEFPMKLCIQILGDGKFDKAHMRYARQVVTENRPVHTFSDSSVTLVDVTREEGISVFAPRVDDGSTSSSSSKI